MRELEELEAIHEEELLLDSVDEFVELSLELRMTFCDELLTSLRELEELLTSLRVLDELFTSLRELEELEAIHEEELLLDPVDELVELSLELRMTFCEELLTSLRELEEFEAIHEEEEDSGSGVDLRDELLLDPIASLQDDDVGASSDDDDAIEQDWFSDHALRALEESSPHAITKTATQPNNNLPNLIIIYLVNSLNVPAHSKNNQRTTSFNHFLEFVDRPHIL